MKTKVNQRIGLVFATVITWIVAGLIIKHQAEPKNTNPIASTRRPVVEQNLLDSVLKSPEQLDRPIAEVSTKSNPEPATEPRPQLLSNIKKPPQPHPLKKPVRAESLYFWKDYDSLRKDEIRNPDSTQNRAGVVALMQTRQRRISNTSTKQGAKK